MNTVRNVPLRDNSDNISNSVFEFKKLGAFAREQGLYLNTLIFSCYLVPFAWIISSWLSEMMTNWGEQMQSKKRGKLIPFHRKKKKKGGERERKKRNNEKQARTHIV